MRVEIKTRREGGGSSYCKVEAACTSGPVVRRALDDRRHRHHGLLLLEHGVAVASHNHSPADPETRPH